jgi:RNA recognition motif-containing protein
MRRPKCVAASREDVPLTKKLYVGNLSLTTTEQQVRALFEPYGTVDRVSLVTDRETGRPRGFAFVEMADGASADSATRGLDGQSVSGRPLRVNEASDRTSIGGGRRNRL